MSLENEQPINETGAAGGETAVPLFSAFRPLPRKSAAEESSPVIIALEARLAELEKRLREAAEKENARGSEKEMLDYLKLKTGELEQKLREAQEKALAFACELKGKEDARNESRLGTEALLAAVKEQQAAAEAEQQQTIELKKSRERIETLEARLTELVNRPPAPPDAGLVAGIEELAGKIKAVSARLDAAAGLPDRVEELAGKLNAVSSRLDASAGLPARLEELAAKIEALPGLLKPVSARIDEAFGRIEAVSARMEVIAKAGLPPEEAEKIRTLLRHDLADTLGPLVKRLETNLHAASEHDLDLRMEHEFSELKKSREELKLLVNSMDKSAEGLAEVLSGRLGEIREGIRGLSAEAAAAGLGAEKAVEWLRGLLKEKGRAAADSLAGSYDVGFLRASLDNLEKCVSSSIDTLTHAQVAGEEPSGPADMKFELLKRRHVSDLEAAIRSLKDGLAAFRGIRPGIVANINKKLSGD